MATSFPPMPQSGGAPAPGGPAPSISDLIGGNQPTQPGNMPTAPTPDMIVSGYMDQIRNLSITLDALAQQFPAAGQDLQMAKQGLLNSMAKVVSSLAQPEAAPTTPTF